MIGRPGVVVDVGVEVIVWVILDVGAEVISGADVADAIYVNNTAQPAPGRVGQLCVSCGALFANGERVPMPQYAFH